MIKKQRKELTSPNKLTAAFKKASKSIVSEGKYSLFEKQIVSKIGPWIHERDMMYKGDAKRYLTVGFSALRNIQEALFQSERKEEINSILDFPSGFGRVLRMLHVSYPDSVITAAEIMDDALSFCAQHYQTKLYKCTKSIEDNVLEDSFDLIWCGSLFTHIDEQSSLKLLKFFHDHLKVNGVCVFSTHGSLTIKRMKDTTNNYRLTDQSRLDLINSYETTGYGYSDYPNQKGYGISAVTRKKMKSLALTFPNWREVYFRQRGWDKHHDVHGYVKTTSSADS